MKAILQRVRIRVRWTCESHDVTVILIRKSFQVKQFSRSLGSKNELIDVLSINHGKSKSEHGSKYLLKT